MEVWQDGHTVPLTIYCWWHIKCFGLWVATSVPLNGGVKSLFVYTSFMKACFCSLVNSLTKGQQVSSGSYGEKITDGIDITTWVVQHNEDSISFSVWDFAGQTVYYNTHQVSDFLSKQWSVISKLRHETAQTGSWKHWRWRSSDSFCPYDTNCCLMMEPNTINQISLSFWETKSLPLLGLSLLCWFTWLRQFRCLSWKLDISLTNQFTDNQFTDKTFHQQDISVTRGCTDKTFADKTFRWQLARCRRCYNLVILSANCLVSESSHHWIVSSANCPVSKMYCQCTGCQ